MRRKSTNASVARELHDDLSQQVALLSIGLEQFELGMPDLSSKARQQLHNIAEVATEVSSNIHDLSHQLRPSKLDTLGLVPSLGALQRILWAAQPANPIFPSRHSATDSEGCDSMPVSDRAGGFAERGVKHSGAPEANVELFGHGDRIDLCISDSGVGCDPKSATGEAGLGLISMRERLRLVEGQLSVESEPSYGTRIQVRVPLFTTNAEATNEGKIRKAGA